MAVSTTPWMGVITTTTANVAQSLQTLIAAATNPPASVTNNPSGILRACYIQIQADPSGGAAKYYIGQASAMTTTSQAGVVLLASQAWTPPHLGGNLYRLDQIWLLSDTDTQKWYVSFVTR